MSSLKKVRSIINCSGAEPKTVMSNLGCGGKARASASSCRPALAFQSIFFASYSMDGLINQSWRHAFVHRKPAPQRDVAGRELARLLAQQNPRGDARLAPAGVQTWFALLRHD